jgi:60 kDa SS-A/Ro ribonucleoprotein
MNYAKHLTATPQTEALSGQVANSAGGYSYAVDPWTRLDRFLVLGAEGGTYYIGEGKLVRENASCIEQCAALDGDRLVNRIVEISVGGRAPKNDPAVFALALCASLKQFPVVVAKALAALPKVCRIGTHLFQFVEMVNELRGWGRGLRRAVADWYTEKKPKDVAFQATKYQQRNGWSHRDLLRLAHPKSAAHQQVFSYIAQPEKWITEITDTDVDHFLAQVEEAKSCSVKRLCELIRGGLVREHIPTDKLNEPAVWEALLEKMPATAMLRNLNKMTELGLLKPLGDRTKFVCDKLRDAEFIKKARLHPMNTLVTLKTYASGHGFRGGKTWNPVPEVCAALEDAFYLGFDAVQPTGKRFLFGIDVSGSMSSHINGTNVSSAEAAGCLAMLGVRTEPRSYAFGFAHSFVDLKITAKDSLPEVYRKVQMSNFGSTDCSVAINHARSKKLEVDAFVIITDCETYAGSIHPSQALRLYRKEMGIEAKMIVIGTASNRFTIADPNDPGQLDICGFDTSIPTIINNFVGDSLVTANAAFDSEESSLALSA